MVKLSLHWIDANGNKIFALEVNYLIQIVELVEQSSLPIIINIISSITKSVVIWKQLIMTVSWNTINFA